MKIINPEYTVEKIVERMREAARQAHSSEIWPAAGSEVAAKQQASFNGNLSIEPLTLQPDFEPAVDDRYHVNDLLKYHDRLFLQNAYQAILKRAPDDAGYRGFSEALQSGELNKIDILARLRYSPEGRAKRVRISGLLAPAALRTTYRVPIIGYLVNLLVAIVRLPVMLKHHRQFETHTLAQQQAIADQINHLSRNFMAHVKEIAGRLSGELDQIARLRVDVQSQIESLREDQATSHEVVLEGVGDLTNYVEVRLNEEASQRQEELWTLGKRLGEVSSQWQEQLNTLGERLGIASAQLQKELALAWNELGARVRQLDERSDAQTATGVSLVARTESLVEGLDSLSQRLDLMRQHAFEETGRVFQKHQQLAAELALQASMLTNLLSEVGSRLPAAELEEDQLRTLVAQKAHLLDAFYAAFDEQFRGSRAGIMERLRVYLPYLVSEGPQEATPILDVGCGRGEWLELLQQQGFRAVGVDSNSVLISQCRERQLDVVEDDLMNYLQKLPDESIGTLTGFHIVEHLPLDILIGFLNETMRVLKPGRPIIFETPNPRNVLVGSCNFYFDPTHQNPLPSEVLKFLVESRGFSGVEILPLNPSDEAPVAGDSELVVRFNQYFYGPMDYGLVGWKAARE